MASRLKKTMTINVKCVAAGALDPRPIYSWHPEDEDNWYYPIENATFRAWRSRRGRGGDFVIFSDVRTESTSWLDFVASKAEIAAAKAQK